MENIVLYLYKKKAKSEQHSTNYINTLISLLKPENNKAKFIVLTEAFGKMFQFE